MSNKIWYFGYGANRTSVMMAAITGNEQIAGESVQLTDYELCIQRLDQIPDIIVPTAPVAQSPRFNVGKSWNNHSGFTTYVIRPAKNKKVIGTLWELTLLERELVRDWELIDFGWYKDAVVKVKTTTGKEIEAQTEILGDNQEIDRVVDGQDYPSFLNKLEEFQRLATQARKEYFERVL